jgi:alanine racemase
MYTLTLKYILEGTGAKLQGAHINPAEDITIRHIAFDSRKILEGKDSLFIALVTDSNDGHKFWADAYKKGIRYFLVSRIPTEHLPADAVFLLVENTLNSLRRLARKHRSQFSGKILAITGSTGKTTVKEWLYFLLSPEISLTATPGSYNSSLGIPLSLLLLENHHRLAIIETGISSPGEMGSAQDLVNPDCGILTNIGSAHAENFTGPDSILSEKLNLFPHCAYWIACAEPAWMKARIKQNTTGKNVLFWSSTESPENRWTIVSASSGNGQTRISISEKRMPTREIEIPFEDQASIENAVHCAVFCLKENLLTETVAERFKKLRPVDLRLQMESGINQCALLADTYTADLSSLRTALQALNLLPGFKKRSLILTDLRLHGRKKEDVYAEAGSLVKESGMGKTILIGKEISLYSMYFSGKTFTYPNTESFLAHFPFSLFQQEAILIKGIREYNPNKIVEFLEQKSHETKLEINLDALTHNLNHFKKNLGPEVKIMAMVKAFSYGSGSIEIANHLKYNNVDYLAVAYTDEGAELRRAGIDLPILVMNAGLPSVSMLLEYQLEPEIFSFRSLDYLADELQKKQVGYELKIHLKIDTGMHRLGFAPDEIEAACQKIMAVPGMRIASVFSHLASAEDPQDDAFTRQQIQLFSACTQTVERTIGYTVQKHLANSAGAQRFPEARFNMVRLGIAMYGISPTESEKNKLKPVLRFKTIISQLRRVSAGDSVGYNRASVLTKDSVIATIPVGYADGFRRTLGQGNAKVWINGNIYPTVGKVCMDMTMIDVTEGNVKEGDEVILFGPEWPVEMMAHAGGTIPYEILTGISPRVKRIYLKE